MSLLDIVAILEERGNFYNRVCGGVLKKATEIYAEDSATPNHAARLEWAKDVIRYGNYRDRTSEMYRLALTLPAVIADADALTDEDIMGGIENFLPSVI